MALFKNLPSEDTPINARNLSRSERYLEAVAGANGDFYVDIDGADGLEAGDILRIAFPAATNGASNARLSIDGASGTYRNFQMGGVNLTADELEERNIVCVYDGTNWGFEGVISGSNANGNWQKFSDGTMIVNRDGISISSSTNISDVGGVIYRSTSLSLGNYSKPFQTTPSLVFGSQMLDYLSNNWGWVVHNRTQNATSAGVCTMLSGVNSGATKTATVSYFAQGRWY